MQDCWLKCIQRKGNMFGSNFTPNQMKEKNVCVGVHIYIYTQINLINLTNTFKLMYYEQTNKLSMLYLFVNINLD